MYSKGTKSSPQKAQAVFCDFSWLLLCLLWLVAFLPQQLRTIDQREKLLAPKVFKNSRNETLLYRLFIPPHYDQKKKYPLVLYLHGGGGIGNDNLKQIDGGNGYLIDFFTGAEAQARYPNFVVAPQSPTEGWIGEDSITPTRQLQLVYELIGELQRAYNIDEARVYVAGQSMGGFGTFAIISEYPRTIVAAIKKAGGNVRYTEYADIGHIIWPSVVKETELLPWLFAQRK